MSFELEKWRREDLRKLARSQGLSTSGSTLELAKRLAEHLGANETSKAKRWRASLLGRWNVLRTASSLGIVQSLVLLYEASGLLRYTFWNLPRHRVTEDGFPTGGPDLPAAYDWLMTSRQCWAPAALWFMISCVLPLVCAYIINPTKRSSYHCTADPFTFNVARLGLAGMVYSSAAYRNEMASGGKTTGSIWGALLSESTGIVCNSVPGGYTGLLVGPIVCAAFSHYDATLNRSTITQHLDQPAGRRTEDRRRSKNLV